MTESLNLMSRPHSYAGDVVLDVCFQLLTLQGTYICAHLANMVISSEDLTRNWKILTNHPAVLDLNPPLSSFQSSAENWRTLILDLMYAAGSY